MLPLKASTAPTPSSLTGADSETPGNDVFISYSRKDKAFVEILDAAFRRLNRDPWVDWEDIHKGEEWWRAIQRGIEAADTFVFVISPDSIASSVCRDEIEHAARCNKRFLPIVRREGFDMQQVHPAVSSHNWLFFRETDAFEPAFQELLKAMDTDLAYVRTHTRLLVRAIEWQTKDRNSSYLLRGSDLQESEQWLAQGVSQQPYPTELQAEYINASRVASVAQLKARQKAQWIVVLTTVVANMLLAIAGGVWYVNHEIDRTKQRVQENLERALDVGLIGINGNEFQRLVNLPVLAGSKPDSYPLYQAHQNWLYKVNQVFPRATLRSYIQGENPNQILWIGDLTRMSKVSKTQFRQSAPAEHGETQILEGVIDRKVIMTPYTDELGNWVSAAGPIKNSAGQVVGGLKVYFKEDYVQQVQASARNALVVGYVVIFVWLFLLSWIILRVTRPPADQST